MSRFYPGSPRDEDGYIVINRGTVPTKMIVTVLPRCSPGLVRGSTTVSPECPGFTTEKPGVTPVVYGGGWLVGWLVDLGP